MPIIPLAVPTIAMVLLLVIPGGLLAVALGLRGGRALAAAFPASVAMISTAAMTTGFVGWQWGILPVAVVSAVGLLIALGVRLILRRLTGPERPDLGRWSGRDELSGYLGLVLAAGVIAFAFLRAFPQADSFALGYDNFFHMAVIRSYLESGQATPFIPNDFADPGGTGFLYPTAWHQLVSLLITTGLVDSIPVAQNALTLAVGCVVWPTSALFMLRSTFRSGPALLVGGGILSAGFAVFPYLTVSFGPLFPYLLAISMLPFGIGLVTQTVRLGTAPRYHRLMLVVLGVLYLGAALMAHPSSLLVWVAISTVLVAARVGYQAWTAAQGRATWVSVRPSAIVLLAVLVVAIGIWVALRPGPHWWPVERTIPQAFGEFWMVGPFGKPAALAITLLVAVGLAITARRPKYLFLLAPTSMVLMLWLSVASFENYELRSFLTGGFYHDPVRLAAVIPIALLPLAVLPFVLADEKLEASSLSVTRTLTVFIVGVVLLTYTTQADRNVREEVWQLADFYRIEPDSGALTPDERQMLRDMPDFVSSGDIVVADTLTGAAWMYSLEGLRPIQYHPKEGLTVAENTLLQHLSDPGMEAEVCAAVHETSADFVVDFGTDQVNMELDHRPPPGLVGLEKSHLVTLVHQVGQARLYEITGCS